MTNARITKAAAFLGVALPALVASAENNGTVPRDEAIGVCVELREKTAVCKEVFADFFAGMAPEGTPPEKRAKYRQRALDELAADGTGPVEPRRQKCADSVDRNRTPYTAEDVKTVRGCFTKKDCREFLACVRPLMEKQFKKTTR